MQEFTADYENLLRNDIPILDVRAPSEFHRGAVPSAVNFPILDDKEREMVGIRYKQSGSEAARLLGHQLVSGGVKEARISTWKKFYRKHGGDTAICCWRGGERSAIARAWLLDGGVDVPRIKGGSKALRAYCMELLESCSSRRMLIVGGRTGVAKTQLIGRWDFAIDLEKLANHRGSAFGGVGSPQPSPVTFENALAVALLQRAEKPCVVVEDESKLIGCLALPELFFRTMQEMPVVLLTASLEERIGTTYYDYVLGANDLDLLSALDRIRKRLGDVRYREIRELMARAFELDSDVLHGEWINRLLTEYYDSMYDYQIEKKRDRVVFEGDRAAVSEFIEDYCGPVEP